MSACVEQEEVDLLEEELDSDDPVRSLQGELSGYQLLYQQYRLVFPYHGQLLYFLVISNVCAVYLISLHIHAFSSQDPLLSTWVCDLCRDLEKLTIYLTCN
jgi:hypothetical protein